MQARNTFARVALMSQHMRYFSTAAKLAQMEVTIRTPYRTLFEGFSGFEFIYVKGIKGQQAIVNNGIPGLYLLPAGPIQLVGMAAEGDGKKTKSLSGAFMHTGGWVHVHE